MVSCLDGLSIHIENSMLYLACLPFYRSLTHHGRVVYIAHVYHTRSHGNSVAGLLGSQVFARSASTDVGIKSF